jgi:hypothetical protein
LSNITKNYQYFREQLNKNKYFNIGGLIESISKLEVVLITLKSDEDDPQSIFESLNSTGLALTEADKIRNFILMRLNSKIQSEYYENYWNKIEKLTNYNVSGYIRDYLTFRLRRIPNINKVYYSFKDYIKSNPWKVNDDTEQKGSCLKELLIYAEYYHAIINANHENKDVNKILSNIIKKLDTKVVIPFLLELFYYNDKNQKERNVNITDGELLEILNVIESLIVRRFICEIPTNGLNKLFMIIGKEIKNWSNYSAEYVNIFKYTLEHYSSTQKFPTDGEMRKKMPLQDFYKMRTQNKMHIFLRLENYGNKESILDLQEMIKDKKVTFEHIMPKTLTEKWEEELGNNFKEIHKKYINTIGNLTFTLYNGELGNKTFEEKKVMDGGYLASKFFLNKYIVQQERWDEKTIKERSGLLTERAIEIWKPYNGAKINSLKISRSSTYEFTLDGDEDVTNFDILAYKYSSSNKIFVNSWIEFYVQISKYLYDFDAEKFRELLLGNDFIDGVIGDSEKAKSELRTAREIDHDVFIEVHGNASSLKNKVLKIFNKLGISTNNARIYCKDKV